MIMLTPASLGPPGPPQGRHPAMHVGHALLAALTCSLPAMPPATFGVRAVHHVGVENTCHLHALPQMTLGVYLAQSVVQASIATQHARVIPTATLGATTVQHVLVENSCHLHALPSVTLRVEIAQTVLQACMSVQCAPAAATQCVDLALKLQASYV